MPNASKMSEIRVAVDANFLNELETKLGITKSTELTRAALSLLDWATDESRNGRQIFTVDAEGKNVHRLVMPELTNISKKH